MIYSLKGRLIKKEENRVILEVSGISYEISVPLAVQSRIAVDSLGSIELVIYSYLAIDGNRGLPVLIGFIDELEREFFEKLISVGGIGPKVALKAFDKPVAVIADAIEKGDLNFLRQLQGVGPQKAKQIIASLQGKVGKFALMKDRQVASLPGRSEIVEEAKQVLRRLQYSGNEIENMIKGVLSVNPQIDSAEGLLNEIYRQRK
jgi:holliday junction DNA helicase RuvA